MDGSGGVHCEAAAIQVKAGTVVPEGTPNAGEGLGDLVERRREVVADAVASWLEDVVEETEAGHAPLSFPFLNGA